MTRLFVYFFFTSRRRNRRYWRDWSSEVCSSDLKQQLLALPEVLGRDDRRYRLPLREREEVGHVTALRRPAHAGQLVDLETVDLAPVGEEEHVVVGRRDKEMLDVVALFELHPGDAHARSEARRVGKECRSR